jgi:hypothetical protein
MELLTKQMAERRGVTEELKAADQMAWVGQIKTFGFFRKSKLQ